MSAADVAPPAPAIPDHSGPSLEEPTSVAPPPTSGAGPDGRVTGANPPPPPADRLPSPGDFEARSEDGDKENKITVDIKPEADKAETNPAVNEENRESTKSVDFTSKSDQDMEVNYAPVVGATKIPEHNMTLSTEIDNRKIVENIPAASIKVKQSRGSGNGKKAPHPTSEGGADGHGVSDGPLSRPLTETSIRDGTKMSYDADRRPDVDRDSSKTPFSVTVERKPLHTAQTRSHSDYYSKTPSSNRQLASLTTSLGQFYGFNGDPHAGDHRFPSQIPRMRRPPKLVRLATVTMSPKTKPTPRGPSLYYEEPRKPRKVITWDAANDARPPLRIDMEGPGPCAYSPRNRPLNETNSPAWTFGSKISTEKAGGSRTSWEKTWFQTPEVWTSKVDFYNDSAWPTPVHYKARPLLGPRQRTTLEAPSFTIGTRKEMTLSKIGSEKEPSPVDYDKDTADKIVLKKAPSFSHQFRREGTVIWSGKEKGPGPGSYTPNYVYNKPHGPAFSIRSLRREKSHVLGPFSTF